MRREKQRCTAAALKSVELLGHEGTYVHDVAQSSVGYNSSSSAYNHFVSMLPVQTVEAKQDKHRGRDPHSSVDRSIHIHPDPAHTLAGGSG